MYIRKQGFPLSKIWNKLLWKTWDKLSPEERLAYEVYYEEKDNSSVNRKINAQRDT